MREGTAGTPGGKANPYVQHNSQLSPFDRGGIQLLRKTATAPTINKNKTKNFKVF